MLNTIMIIDCDQCGQPSDSLAVSLRPEDHARAMALLNSLLQQDGWHIFHNKYRCPDCILNEMAARETGS